MIKYRLGCSQGHEFDAWFQSSSAFETLLARGEVTCVSCGCQDVDRLPMSPAVMSSRSGGERPSKMMMTAGKDDSDGMELMRKLRTHLLASSEYVGPRFAEEARKIHYGETEARTIHGEALSDEARALREEGIAFGVIPTLPEDHN